MFFVWMKKAAIGAAVDAFFGDARRIFAEQGVRRESLSILGGELGKLAAVVYGAPGEGMTG